MVLLKDRAFKDLIKVLEISNPMNVNDPDRRIIEKAFRKLALKTHPDKGGDPLKFKKINDAYNRLMEHVMKLEVLESDKDLASTSVIIEISKQAVSKWIERLRIYGQPRTSNFKSILFEGPYKHYKGRSRAIGPLAITLYEDPQDGIPKLHIRCENYMLWIQEQQLPLHLHVKKDKKISFDQWRIMNVAEFGFISSSIYSKGSYSTSAYNKWSEEFESSSARRNRDHEREAEERQRFEEMEAQKMKKKQQAEEENAEKARKAEEENKLRAEEARKPWWKVYTERYNISETTPPPDDGESTSSAVFPGVYSMTSNTYSKFSDRQQKNKESFSKESSSENITESSEKDMSEENSNKESNSENIPESSEKDMSEVDSSKESNSENIPEDIKSTESPEKDMFIDDSNKESDSEDIKSSESPEKDMSDIDSNKESIFENIDEASSSESLQKNIENVESSDIFKKDLSPDKMENETNADKVIENNKQSSESSKKDMLDSIQGSNADSEDVKPNESLKKDVHEMDSMKEFNSSQIIKDYRRQSESPPKGASDSKQTVQESLFGNNLENEHYEESLSKGILDENTPYTNLEKDVVQRGMAKESTSDQINGQPLESFEEDVAKIQLGEKTISENNTEEIKSSTSLENDSSIMQNNILLTSENTLSNSIEEELLNELSTENLAQQINDDIKINREEALNNKFFNQNRNQKYIKKVPFSNRDQSLVISTAAICCVAYALCTLWVESFMKYKSCKYIEK